MKAAIVVLSDAKTGSEDALRRVFNALAAAYDFKQRGDDVTILFQGTGTRWISELAKAEHPVHKLFEEVKDKVAGASSGCAEVFGANEGVEKSGFDLISENAVPGTAGLLGLRKLASESYSVLVF